MIRIPTTTGDYSFHWSDILGYEHQFDEQGRFRKDRCTVWIRNTDNDPRGPLEIWDALLDPADIAAEVRRQREEELRTRHQMYIRFRSA